MIKVPVNIVWDITLGVNSHTLWVTVVPAPAPSTPTFAFEMVATQMWTAGYLMGKNQFTDNTVKAHNMPVCLDGHDLGPLIPDVTIPFVNLYYAIMWPFSSRKMAFSASTVKMCKKPVACADILGPFPMMTCGDPLTLPTAFPVTNRLHNTYVGMTLGDVLVGIAGIAVSIAVDAVFEWVKPFSELGGSSASNAFVGEALGKLGFTPKSAVKNAVGQVAGWAVGAIASAIEPHRDMPAFKLTTGGPADLGIQIGGNPDDAGFHSPGSVGGTAVGVTHATPGDPLNIF